MKRNIHKWILIIVGVVILPLMQQCTDNSKLNALIITGQHTLDWAKSSENMKVSLENSELFKVNIYTTPAKGEDMSSMKPALDNYDVVIINYAGDAWPDEVKSGLQAFVKGGKGLVVCNSSVLSFPEWQEFSAMTGVSKKQGIIAYNAESGILEPASIEADFNENFESRVFNRVIEHPILAGLNDVWMHTKDAFYPNLSSTGDSKILATAWIPTGRRESCELPIMWANQYGDGRVITCTLGSLGSENNPTQCAGFITIIQRSAEWCATGVVSQEVPVTFPNYASTLEWQYFRPLKLEEVVARMSKYQMGMSKEYLNDFRMRIRQSDKTPESYAKFENIILSVLQSDATVDCKKLLCRELSWMGSSQSVPVLKKFIDDPELSEMADYALQRLQ